MINFYVIKMGGKHLKWSWSVSRGFTEFSIQMHWWRIFGFNSILENISFNTWKLAKVLAYTLLFRINSLTKKVRNFSVVFIIITLEPWIKRLTSPKQLNMSAR